MIGQPRHRRPANGPCVSIKGKLGTVQHRGAVRAQWQYEVTGAGRIWYVADPDTRTVWLTLCETGHPKATD